MAKSGFTKDHLRSFIERVERLEEEKKALAEDIKEVYAEAKGQGFDTKIMRKIVAERKMETADRQEQEAMLDLYRSALGMLSDMPLGEAAVRAAMTPSPRAQKSTRALMPEKPQAEPPPLPPHDPETGEVTEPAAASTTKKFAERVAERVVAGELGTPVPLTEEEKAKGVMAAWTDKDGTRCSIGAVHGRETELAHA